MNNKKEIETIVRPLFILFYFVLFISYFAISK